MPRPSTVIAYHVCWTAYGTWLPNDPRGSGSQAVATSTLAELGEPHYGRKRLQPAPATVRQFQKVAEERLKYSVMRFGPNHIEAIADAFGRAVAEHAYTCYACAILSDHAHLVLRKHKHRAKKMIDNLQQARRGRLSTERLIPHDHPRTTIPAGPKAAGGAF